MNPAKPNLAPVRAVIVAGPSGSGKTRLANRLALPILNLDDFYRDGDEPGLPLRPDGQVDWDDPGSWNRDQAVAAIAALCTHSQAQVPTYQLSANARIGSKVLRLGGTKIFLAEGIFAQEIVAECRARGLAADALCLTQNPLLTFIRRLVRDLREHRKPPTLLIRRGLRLAAEQRSVLARATELGCEPISPAVAEARIRTLID